MSVCKICKSEKEPLDSVCEGCVINISLAIVFIMSVLFFGFIVALSV